jgi:hypothetical protein
MRSDKIPTWVRWLEVPTCRNDVNIYVYLPYLSRSILASPRARTEAEQQKSALVRFEMLRETTGVRSGVSTLLFSVGKLGCFHCIIFGALSLIV